MKMKFRASVAVSLLYLALAILPVAGMVFHAPDVTIHGWWTIWERPKLTTMFVPKENFPMKFERWFDQNLGFRGVATYADNTILYHVFRETKPGAPVKRGLSGMLINDEDTIYFSKDHIDLPKEERILDLAERIDRMQKRLAKNGSALIPLIIPSKSTMYPELVAPAWKRDLGMPRPSDVHVYETLRDDLRRRGTSFVDARELFLEQKEPQLHSLVPQPKDKRHLLWGLDARHWTFFGACLAVQKVMLKYTEMTGIAQKPHECHLRMMDDAPPWYDDYDLTELMNVWGVPYTAKQVPRADHPETKVDPKLQANVPSLLIVGTSFNWIVLKDTEAANAVKDVHFIYYNRTVVTWPSGKQVTLDAKSELWRRAALGKQLYLLDLYESYIPVDYAFWFLADLEKALDEGQVAPPPLPEEPRK